MNKSKLIAFLVMVICVTGVVTMLSWPQFQGGTWQLISSPKWWQFEWLAAIGLGLIALPSIVIASLNEFVEMNKYVRFILVSLFVFIELVGIYFFIYKVSLRFNKQ